MVFDGSCPRSISSSYKYVELPEFSTTSEEFVISLVTEVKFWGFTPYTEISGMGSTRGFWLILWLIPLAAAWGAGKDRVRLADLQVFTAQKGHHTAARRVNAIPQMSCVGGSAGCKYEPSTIQCYNRGSDGRSIQWECKADLDDRVKFGSVHVLCEGYDFPGDEYVLAGSCGVEFTLEPVGKEKSWDWSGGAGTRQDNVGGTSSFLENVLFWAVIGILIYAVYAIFFKGSLGENAYSPVDSDFPGGGGDARTGPPPPGFRPEYRSSDSGSSSYGPSCGSASRGAGGSNPLGGFWTGAATGGMLGYMFGNRNRGYERPYGYSDYAAPSQPSYFSRPSHSYERRSSNNGGSTRSSSGFGGTSVR